MIVNKKKRLKTLTYFDHMKIRMAHSTIEDGNRNIIFTDISSVDVCIGKARGSRCSNVGADLVLGSRHLGMGEGCGRETSEL
jgi:hypothetical protein